MFFGNRCPETARLGSWAAAASWPALPIAPLLLLGGHDGDTLPSAGATPPQHGASRPSSHTCSEPVGSLSTLVMGLVRTLHDSRSGCFRTVIDSRQHIPCQAQSPPKRTRARRDRSSPLGIEGSRLDMSQTPAVSASALSYHFVSVKSFYFHTVEQIGRVARPLPA